MSGHNNHVLDGPAAKTIETWMVIPSNQMRQVFSEKNEK